MTQRYFIILAVDNDNHNHNGVSNDGTQSQMFKPEVLARMDIRGYCSVPPMPFLRAQSKREGRTTFRGGYLNQKKFVSATPLIASGNRSELHVN